MVKTVAVIGAGASGLTAIKCCLDEGLQPTCYERTSDIGGLWNFTEEVREDQACVMRSTVINTSKEMMCYSDFPIPQEYPIFMHNKYVNQYFHLYADKFELRNYIKFDHEILSVCNEGTSNENTEQWQLKVNNKSTGEIFTKRYDAVLVCTGHHATKKLPDFPGLKDFKGKIVHSHDYKDSDGYKNKRIVVVGIGNSGGDCAVELSRTASQVYLSTRRGSWVLNRIAENGLPVDMTNTRKVTYLVRKIIGDKLLQPIIHSKLNSRFDHAAYSLQPKHGFLAQHPTVNDDLPNRIICGSCIVKPDIKRITETAVDFEDGTSADNVDVILLATGYIFGFPFLDKSVVDVCENQVNLYKWVFPPSYENIAVIGCVQPLGAIMPISELQCRLALRVFKGEVQLPSKEQMLEDISVKRNEMSRRYVKSSRHTIQVDYVLYMDELAEIAGCKPNILQLFKSDPKLALQCFLGPCTPYQYRLQGPGKWEGAKDAIFTQWQRTMHPLKTRPLGFKKLSVCKEGSEENNSKKQWQLKVKNKSTVEIFAKRYDAVLVCTGHHATKKLPDFPGLKDFKGKIVHSHDYKDSDGYKNKRVVVVGIGNSGGDCAVELSRTASQVYLSTRRGSWVLNRIAENGLPVDMTNTRKVTYLVRKIIGDKLLQPIIHSKLNSRFDHAAYSLQPKHGFLAQHPTVNDDLPNRIICGSCIVKPDIKRITETAVDFDDGTSADNVDVILLATGYIFGFPFLDKSVVDVCENQVNLYKWVFPPSHENIAVIGCVQPLGAIMPISELQCRLALRVFKGEVQLPSKEQMLEDISLKRNEMSRKYVKSSRHTIQVDYVLYMDELAEMAGCKPNILQLFKSDPKLALQCFLGPCTPYQYRLQGPGKWEGAKDAIFTQWQRTMHPLKTRPLGFKVEKSQVHFFVFFMVFILMFAYIVQFLFMN